MASMSDPNSPGAARRAARMVRSGQTPKPAVKQKLVVDPRPPVGKAIKTPKNPPVDKKIVKMGNDSKLLAKLPVTQAHLNTIKKYYGI